MRDNLLLLMLEPMGSPISVARAIGHVGEQIGAAKEPRAQALEGEPVVQHEQEQEEEQEQEQESQHEEEENGDGAALTVPAARESGSRMKLESPAADSGNSSDGGGADQADTHDHGVDNSSNSDADDDDDDDDVDDDDESSDETQNNNEARRDQTEDPNNGDDTNNNSSDDTGRQLLCCRRHRAAEGRPHHCHARPVRWRPRAHERQHPP